MRYEIVLSPEAVEDLRGLRAHLRATVRDVSEKHLRDDPDKVSKSSIKRLCGRSRPQFRLRVHEIRVYYDVSEGVVEILAIIPKSQSEAWLERAGEPE